MFLKKLPIHSHIFQFCPAFHIHRVFIQVINFGAFDCQKEGRMGGYKKLTSKETGRIFQKPGKFYLFLRRKTWYNT